jgi:hypothetical protein
MQTLKEKTVLFRLFAILFWATTFCIRTIAQGSDGYPLRQQIIPLDSEVKVVPGLFYKIENIENLLQLGIDNNLKPGALVKQQRRVAEGGLWEFVPVTGGYFAIKNKLSGNYVDNFSAVAGGTSLRQSEHLSDGASWRLQDLGNNQFKLINKASGLLLGSGGETASHTPVLQLPESGEGILWRLVVYDINPSVAIITTRNGEVVSGGNLSQLFAYNPSTGKVRFLMAKGIGYEEDGWVKSLLESADGTYWVGLDRGLRQVDPVQGTILQNYLSYTHPAFLSNEIQALLEDADGTIWAGTFGGGLVHVFPKTKQAVNFLNADNYSGNFISAMFPWKNGRLLVNTLDGAYYFEKDGKKFVRSNPLDNLPDHPQGITFLEKPGNGIPSGNGLDNAIDNRTGAKPDNPSSLIFTNFSYFDESRDTLMSRTEDLQSLKKITLRPSVSWFRFDYAQLKPDSPQGSHFQTWLEGFEDGWTYQGSLSFIRYNRLPAGNYVLHVRTAHAQGNGESPEELTIAITVRQVFYKTWWAILLYCLGAGAVVYAVVHYRFRQRLALESMRTRIASDLHDEVGSSLSHLNFLVGSFDLENAPEQTAAGIKKSKEIMQKTASDIRDVVWAIDARRDKTGDLLDRMEDFAFDMFSAKNIACHFHADSINREAVMNPFVRQNIFLIFKEAVNNIAKHSNASEVRISLSQTGGSLELTVTDNGSTAPNSKHSTGLGLDNMQLRAKRIGGTVESGQGEAGWVVRLRV